MPAGLQMPVSCSGRLQIAAGAGGERDTAWRRASLSGTALVAAVEQHRQQVRAEAPAVLGRLEAAARLKIARSVAATSSTTACQCSRISASCPAPNTPASKKHSRTTVWPDSDSCITAATVGSQITAASMAAALTGRSCAEQQAVPTTSTPQQQPQQLIFHQLHSQQLQPEQHMAHCSSSSSRRRARCCWQQQHLPGAEAEGWAGASSRLCDGQGLHEEEECRPLIPHPPCSCRDGKGRRQAARTAHAQQPSPAADSRWLDPWPARPAALSSSSSLPSLLMDTSSRSDHKQPPRGDNAAVINDDDWDAATTAAPARRRSGSPIAQLLETCHAAACAALHGKGADAGPDTLLEPLLYRTKTEPWPG